MDTNVCQVCGAQLELNGKFCPKCGHPVSTEADGGASEIHQAPAIPPYQAPQPVYQQTTYQAAIPKSGVAPVLSTGSYVGMFILAGIPIVGLIMLLVWAFSSNENPNKKNYARAALLLGVIIMVITFALTLILGGSILSLMPSLNNY